MSKIEYQHEIKCEVCNKKVTEKDDVFLSSTESGLVAICSSVCGRTLAEKQIRGSKWKQ